jgi:putative Ca2+/H+ antiporter (TMEM165/GDT1 family)
LSLFLSTFSVIFLAELPDKTALATLLLASKGGRMPVFSGVALAFLIQCVIAVGVGNWIGQLSPLWVKAATGFLFLIFAFMSYRKLTSEDESETTTGHHESQTGFMQQAGKAFMVIFLAEWGDLTQLTTASLSARYPTEPAVIFTASLLALWSVTAIAVVLGERLARWVSPRRLLAGSAALFGLMGAWFLMETALQMRIR